jgi:hypothetical protein
MNVVMKRLVAVLAFVVPATAARADRTAPPTPTVLDCATAPSPSIATDKGEYKITGTCEKVTITGSQNMVTVETTKNLAITGGKNEVLVDKVDKIAITGTTNRVTYKMGVTGAAPKTAAAQGNMIRKTAPPPDDLLTEKPLPGATLGPAPATIDCAKTAKHTLSSNHGSYTFTGTCALITITGNMNIVRAEKVMKIAIGGKDNTVTVDAVGTLSVTGTQNTALYGKGLGRAKPAITKSGKNHTVAPIASDETMNGHK